MASDSGASAGQKQQSWRDCPHCSDGIAFTWELEDGTYWQQMTTCGECEGTGVIRQ